MESKPLVLNINLIGDPKVGKSSLLVRETQWRFDELPTISVDFFVKEYNLGDEKVKVRLWDQYISSRFVRYYKAQFKSNPSLPRFTSNPLLF
jgi:hypothetical protein